MNAEPNYEKLRRADEKAYEAVKRIPGVREANEKMFGSTSNKWSRVDKVDLSNKTMIACLALEVERMGGILKMILANIDIDHGEIKTGFYTDILEKQIPHLRHIRLPTHRAVVELILAAIIARRDEVRKDHHPNFILFGPTMKFKTWIVKAICAILGDEYETHIILMPSESGGSILFRKGSSGKLVSKRNIIDHEFVCFDELHNATTGVRKTCLNFLQGEMEISVENETMTLHPVPIITYNPKEGENMGERIQFESQNIRRSVLCDFQDLDIPMKIARDGTKILDRLGAMPNLSLPGYRGTCEDYRNDVFEFLETIKHPQFPVDTEMILVLSAGMTAFLPDDQAVVVVLDRYLTVIETLGYLPEGWEDKFETFKKDILCIEDEKEKNAE